MLADFDGVTTLGVDEHVRRHTRRGDKYVTVIVDLNGIRNNTGPAQLLDTVEGRSKQVLKTWLNERPQAWRDAVEIVAVDGFTGYQTASEEPEAVTVMDPFHVIRSAGDALDHCRRRIQQIIHRHRDQGRPAPQRPPHPAQCRSAHRQAKDRLTALFDGDKHVQVEAPGGSISA